MEFMFSVFTCMQADTVTTGNSGVFFVGGGVSLSDSCHVFHYFKRQLIPFVDSFPEAKQWLLHVQHHTCP